MVHAVSEDQEVIQWRFDQLVAMGVPAGVAHGLAESARIDVAQVRELVKQGCPWQTAVQIVA